MIGGFWSTVVEGPTQMDVVAVISLSPDEAGPHEFAIRLVGSVEDDGPAMVGIDGKFGPSDPDAAAAQGPSAPPIVASFTFQTPGMALSPGKHRWILELDGTEIADWPFLVLPNPDAPPSAN